MRQDIREQAILYLRRLEAGDFSGMRALCTEKATVWHNDGKGEQSIDENLEMLGKLTFEPGSLRYDIIRQFDEPNEVLQQHVLHVTGGAVYAAMYFRFDGGLIDRIEEYANFVPSSAGAGDGA